MKKIFFIIGIIAIIGLGIFAVLNIVQKSKTDSKKITVITTLFPMYDFAKNIGQDKIEVKLLLPPGVEAHAYEPKPSDIIKINKADIFIYTGEFMEPWAHDIIEGINKNVKIVNSSNGIELIKQEGEENQEEIDQHEKEEHHHHSGVDPHIWLDFENTKTMVKNIADALEKVDPQNAIFYQNNLKTYQIKLLDLDENYKNTIATCKTKTIIYGGHYAFGYMAKKYELNYLAAQGFSPDSEPTVKDMISLIEQIKKDNIGYIFYEELTSPKIAETLSRETNTKMLLLNGAHNLTKEDYEAGASYISLMEGNLKNLAEGLNCQK